MKKLITFLCIALFALFQTYGQDEFGFGLEFDENLYEEVPQSVPLVTRSFTKLPSSYSLKAYAPTPRSQGRQGSCVGWATAFGARTISNAIKNGWENQTYKINQNVFSPSYVYNQIRVNDKCQGAYIESAMKFINSDGVAKLSDFSYDEKNCTKTASSNVQTKAKENKIVSFEKLARWNNPVNLVGKVKKAISEKNPVVIGLFNFST